MNKKSQITILVIIILFIVILTTLFFMGISSKNYKIFDGLTGKVTATIHAKAIGGNEIGVEIDTTDTQKIDLIIIIPIGFLIFVIALFILSLAYNNFKKSKKDS